MHSVCSLFTLDKVTGYDLLCQVAGTFHNLWLGGNGDFFPGGASESGEHNKLSATKSIASSSVSSVMEKSVTRDETLKAEILWALKAIMSHYSYKSCEGMEGNTGQKWN